MTVPTEAAAPIDPNEVANKRVWVIGAGASKSHSRGEFPTLIELPRKAEQLGLLGPVRKHPEGHYAQLRRYVKRRFGATLDEAGSELNLELVYTTLELDLLIRPDPELAASRVQLVRLLRDTIRAVQSRGFDSAREYEWLVSHLGTRDTIITFNWDVLLDNALGRKLILKDRQGEAKNQEALTGHYWNFILGLSGWGEMTVAQMAPPPPHTTRQWDGETGYFLKAHGSIDWFYCGNQLCRSFGSAYPVWDTRKQWYCGSCHETMQLLLVPPTLNKGIRDFSILRRIWNVAARELAIATEVLVWGYSLPQTDFFSDWLLRQARTPHCKHVTVIDPSVSKEGSGGVIRRDFVDRFRSAFRSVKETRLFTFYRDFEAYRANSPAGSESG